MELRRIQVLILTVLLYEVNGLIWCGCKVCGRDAGSALPRFAFEGEIAIIPKRLKID
jgi:hypothetical protein